MIEITKIKCRLINLVVQTYQPLTRQIIEVSVMLEKLAGNTYVKKLRAILLLKAYFNALHKIIFNGRMVLALVAKDDII